MDDQLSMWDALAMKLLSSYGQGNSQQTWEKSKQSLSGSQYFDTTGSIRAGGTGDIAMRDSRGNIVGYQARNRSAGGLTPGLDARDKMQTGAGIIGNINQQTPGLNAFHAMNPAKPKPVAGGLVNDVAADESFGGGTNPQTAAGAGLVVGPSVRRIPTDTPDRVNRISFPNMADDPARRKSSLYGTPGYDSSVQAFNANLYRPSDTRTAAPSVMIKPPSYNTTGWNTTPNPGAIEAKYRTPGYGITPAVDTANFVKSIFA